MVRLPGAHSQPNIVLIVLDSVRRDHLSCYGHSRETTPNIDRIASRGVQFMRAYATSCWTIPSHGSLFTGLYPSHHRVDFDTKYLEPHHTTLATYLKGLGYQTASFSCNGFIADWTNLTHGFDLAVDIGRLAGTDRRTNQQDLAQRLAHGLHRRWRNRTARDRGAQRATTLARRWIRTHDRSRPFFLFLNYMDCHAPYRLRGPERYRFVAPQDRQRVDQVPQDPFASMAGRLDYSTQDIEDLKALYDGCLAYLDQQIGTLDAELEQLGLADRTLLIVTSDHGESFSEHGLMDHQYGLYEHLLRVPLIVRFPGGEVTGQTRHELVQLTDLFPTVVQLLERGRTAARLLALPGWSLLESAGRAEVVAEYVVPNLRAFWRRFPDVDVSRYNVALRAISTGEHKLIWRSDGRLELYDLCADPNETTSIAGIHEDIASRLKARLQEQLGPWPGPPTEVDEDVSDEVRQRLEALGYL